MVTSYIHPTTMCRLVRQLEPLSGPCYMRRGTIGGSGFLCRSGNPVRNQFILEGDGFTAFQSYDTVIVKKTYGDGHKVYLDRDAWDYSVTTGKYRNLFLGETKAETERKIKDGTYILADLNG